MVHPFRHSIMSTKMIAGRVVTKKRGYKEVFIHQNIFPVQYCSEAFLWLKGQNMEPKMSMEQQNRNNLFFFIDMDKIENML